MEANPETTPMERELRLDAAAAAATAATSEDTRRREKPPDSRSCGGAVRLLTAVLRAAVMAAALSLFLIFAGAAAVALIYLLFAARAFRRPHHRIHRHRRAKVAGLSTGELRGLPTFRSKAAEGEDGAGGCAVCLDGLRSGERCRMLPECEHVFHSNCVDRWLVRSPSCPICRRLVTPARRRTLWC